jgi:hypothetical protein
VFVFLVLNAEKPKKLEVFLVPGACQLPKPIPETKKDSMFFGFSASKTKKTNTLSRKPKEHKKLEGTPKKSP